MSASALVLLSYVLLGVFVVAFVVRAAKLAKMPVHLRWELAPVPHEKGKSEYGGSYLEDADWWTKPREKDLLSEISYMAKEILFLKALWEHNRRLWRFSFPFHAGLYLLSACFVLLVLGGLAHAVGISGPGWGIVTRLLPVLAGAGYLLGAVGAVGLFATRLADRDMANSTAPVTFFNLILLLALFGSGLWALVSSPVFSRELLAYVTALFTAELGGSFRGAMAVHALVAGVFLAYLPFTQMMHFVAKYFTYHKVRWDDEPVTPGSKLDRELKKLLYQPVSWAAPHVGADGRKTWVEIATETPRPEGTTK